MNKHNIQNTIPKTPSPPRLLFLPADTVRLHK